MPYNGRVGLDAGVEELVEQVVKGDGEAWEAFWVVLDPMLERIASSPQVSGKMSQDVDHCRNIVVEVMYRLKDDDFRRLRLYLGWRADRPDLTFEPWIRKVARRVTIDYMRGLGEYIDQRRKRDRKQGAPNAKWLHITALTSTSRLNGVRPAITNVNTALKMWLWARRKFPPEQVEALEHWMAGLGFEGIAETLKLEGADRARKLVRAALQRLRREFREKDED